MFLQIMYQNTAGQWLWWSSYSYTISKQTSLNKPSSKVKLFKKQFHQKYLSGSLYNEQKQGNHMQFSPEKKTV